MKLGSNSTHTIFATDLPNVGERRCIKMIHNRTGLVTYKVEHFLKTFKTLNGLAKHANKLRAEFDVQ
jgi:hypothetical protein